MGDSDGWRLIKLLLLSGFLILSIYLVISNLFSASSTWSFSFKSPTANSSNSKSLPTVVNEQLVGSKGSYAIAILNLKTNESFYLDAHKQYPTASLYKLWVMATAYKKIADNSLDETENLSSEIRDLNSSFNILESEAELTDGTITLPVSEAIKQMITISHNYAALLLTKRIKLSSVRGFVKEAGFDESSVGEGDDIPTTTASDMADFFEKLYKQELGTPETTNQMIVLLKNQQLNDKLPKYLPEEIEVAHKTGEIDYFSHDGGIVYTPTDDYIIVVLSESSSPEGANERIANLSKAVYDYFNSD